MDATRNRQRRRRVSMDQASGVQEMSGADNSSDLGTAATATDSKRAARPYSQGARRSRQFKITDLIPKRCWSVASLVALLLSAIAGLNLLHLNSPNWIDSIGAQGVAVLSLDNGRSLGVWYSNFLLLLTSCVSLQLYLLRRHRRDDYQGSYRIWLWMAAIFLLASAASVTGISGLARALVSTVIGAGPDANVSNVHRGLFWVCSIKIGGLLLLVIRGLVEVRFSRLAVLGLLVVLFSYGTAIVIHEVPDVQVQASDYIHASLGNCLLLGCTFLFVSVLGFARYVYLDANGLIQHVENEARKARKLQRAEQRRKAKLEKAQAKLEKQDARQAAREEKRAARQVAAEEKAKAKRAAKLAAKEAAADKVGEQDKKGTEQRDSAKQARRQAATAKPSSADPPSGKPVVVSKSKRKKTPDVVGPAKSPNRPGSSKAKVAVVKAGQQVGPKQSGRSTEVGSVSGNVVSAKNEKRKANVTSTADEYLLAMEDSEQANLSKSERRRLKKLKRRAA